MPRKNKKGGRRGGGDDSGDDDDGNEKAKAGTAPLSSGPQNKNTSGSSSRKGSGPAPPQPLVPTAGGGLSRKQQKQQKQQAKRQQQHHASNARDSGTDEEDDDGSLAALLGGKLRNAYGAGSSSSEEEEEEEEESSASGDLRRGGRSKKEKNHRNNDAPPGKAPKRKNKGRNQTAVAVVLDEDSEEDDDDDGDDDDDDGVSPTKSSSGFPSKTNRKKNATALAEDVGSDEEDLAKMEDEDEDDGIQVEQVAFKLADDEGWGGGRSSRKKKDKKEKKEKKHKKDKKKKMEKKNDPSSGSENAEDHREREVSGTATAEPFSAVNVVEEESASVPTWPTSLHPDTAAIESDAVMAASNTASLPEPKKKSKFELQMEAAMSKKKATEQETSTVAATKTYKKAAVVEPEPDWVDTTKKSSSLPEKYTVVSAAAVASSDNHDEDVVYGSPDDVVWSDKSHAQRLAEDAKDAGNESDIPLVGPDGKKLSNKERKKLQKAKEAEAREAAFQQAAAVASKEGAQFACSQTAVNENDAQWENSLDVSVPSFSISAAGKILFKDASLTIAHGRRYGLVGPNGRGKSTLLKMIASRDLKLPPRIDFLYVEQEVVADDTPAVEAVLKADTRRWDLLEEEKKLMQAVDNGDESEGTISRLQQVVDELTSMGADSADSKARRILYGLGFTMEMQTKPTRMFSGGWRMRISLARALFIEPTLLLLDEPTNHLDLNAVLWLDEYLQKWKKTLLIVSHDQDFLNSVCQEILHIEDLKLISYKGNYDDFKKAEKVKFEQQVKAWEKQEKRLRELKKSGQSRAKAQETVMKSISKRESGARAQKKKNQAIAAGTEAAEAAELIKRPREYQVKLQFAEVAELSRPVIEVSNVHFRYSPKHPVIFDKIDFGIDMDSRICVVGPNGAGKTTLLKLLTGELDPTTGEVKRNPRLRMGIYNQHFVDRLPMNKTPIEHLRDRFQEEDYQSIRNRLGKYGLEGHAHEVAMRDLSGGQKARVVFVELSLQRPHVLLLDEPTNNLDIETIDALCDAINEFNGGIVVVTHDQRLIEECECSLWVVEKQGVTKWEEGFDDYKANILRELEEHVEREAAVRRERLEAAAQVRAEKLARLASKVKKPAPSSTMTQKKK